MLKLLFTLLFFCLISIALSSTVADASTTVLNKQLVGPHHHIPHSKKSHVKCVHKCFNSVKDVRVRACKKAYIRGGIRHRCSLKKIKGNCRQLCTTRKFCTNKCKHIVCGGKKIRSCKKNCTHGRSCLHKCQWIRTRRCIRERLPPRLHKKCSFITKQVPFKRCLRKCIKKVRTHTCTKKCSTIHIPHKYKKCLKILKAKGHTKKICSIGAQRRSCKKTCKKGVRRCFKKCTPKRCGKHVFSSCKWKCTTSRRKCLISCTWKKQERCYMKRFPPKYVKKCATFLTNKKVSRCLKRCVCSFKVFRFTRGVKRSAKSPELPKAAV
jgi:hypothetical protein